MEAEPKTALAKYYQCTGFIEFRDLLNFLMLFLLTPKGQHSNHSSFTISGGFRGGAGGAHLPGCPNSFDFMQFLGQFGKIVCWRPPWGFGAPWRNPGSAADNNTQS